MSIIEKAVDKLQKGGGKPSARGKDSSVIKSDSGNKAVPQPDVYVSPQPQERMAQKEPTKKPAKRIESSQSKREQLNLPLAKLASMGMITPDVPRSRIAEEYRTIKRPLLMNIEGKGASQVENANLIMVTSALAGEGKTFSAVNLAPVLIKSICS